MNRISKNRCPVCESSAMVRVLEISGVPVHCNILWENRDDALNAPRGDIDLEFCETCGHLFNSAFDPDQMHYSERYENALHFSHRFQAYAKDLAERLIADHGLRGKDIIDIGCGDGEFLKLLCDLGGNRGVGFDPGMPDRLTETDAQATLRFIKDVYTKKYAYYPADFICCRQVLEHLVSPGDFLCTLRNGHAADACLPFFFEVPNSEFILKEFSIWDIIYEHYSYFSTSSLNRLLEDYGFDVQKIEKKFGGQYLCASAFSGKREPNSFTETPDAGSDIRSHAMRFAAAFKGKIEKLAKKLCKIKTEGKKPVLWGAGSKGVTFLNLLHIKDEIPYAVDMNPRKQNMYVAGTGQQIVHPNFLNNYAPDIIILSNPIYEQEIRQMVKNHKFSVNYLRL